MTTPVKYSILRVVTWPGLFQLMNRLTNKTPIIFTLHRKTQPEFGIRGHEPATLRAQLEFVLNRGYRAVTMDVINAWLSGKEMDMTNTVAFTFDDGFRDQAELVREVFLPLEIPATMFLITDFIDGTTWPWDTRIKWIIHTAKSVPITPFWIPGNAPVWADTGADERHHIARQLIQYAKYLPPERQGAAIAELASKAEVDISSVPPPCHTPMSWEEARLLEKEGIRFASHTKRHCVLSTLSYDEAKQQIWGARDRLHAELAAPIKSFAYPIGLRSDYMGRDLCLLKESGHESAVTMTPGAVVQTRSMQHYEQFQINRYAMPDTLADFAQYASWIERLKVSARELAPNTRIRNRFGSTRGLVKLIKAKFDYRLGRINAPNKVDWSTVSRLVFICQGNVCRSPFAEAVARQQGVDAISLGLKTNQGTPVNAIASRIALEMGFNINHHKSTLFTPEVLREGDLILCMEPRHLNDSRYAVLPVNVQITLLGMLNPQQQTPFIQDPYDLSDEYYRRCLALIRSTVESIAHEWKNAQHTFSQRVRKAAENSLAKPESAHSTSATD